MRSLLFEGWNRWVWVAGLVLVGLGLQLSRVVCDPLGVSQIEDGYNATTARQLLQVGLKQCVQDRYVDYCGGCTVDAFLGAAAFRVLGESLFVWKLVPLLYWLLMLVAGTWVLDRVAGFPCATLYAVFVVFMPSVAADFALFAWGNHSEGATLSIVVFAVAVAPYRSKPHHPYRYAFIAGLLAGGTLWFFIGTAVVLPAVVVGILALSQRQLWPRAVGLLAGGATLGYGLLQLVSPIPISHAIYGGSPLAHVRSTTEIGKLADLAPLNLGYLLAGETWAWSYAAGLVGLLVAGAVVVFVPRSRRSPAFRLAGFPTVALLLYVGAYVVSSFDVLIGREHGAVPTAYEIRYFAPIAWLIPLLAACLGSALLKAGYLGKTIAALVTTLLLLPMIGRVEGIDLGNAGSDAFRRKPYDYEFYLVHNIGLYHPRITRDPVDWLTDDTWTRWTSQILHSSHVVRNDGHETALERVETADEAFALGWTRGAQSIFLEDGCADLRTAASLLPGAMVSAYEQGLVQGLAQLIRSRGVADETVEDGAPESCDILDEAEVFAFAGYHGDSDLHLPSGLDVHVQTALDLVQETGRPELGYWFGMGLRGRVECGELLCRAAAIVPEASLIESIGVGCEQGWALSHSDDIVPGEVSFSRATAPTAQGAPAAGVTAEDVVHNDVGPAE